MILSTIKQQIVQYAMLVIPAVYKGAGEQNMSPAIRTLHRTMADLSDLVLHTIHFLHRGVIGVTRGRSSGLKIWQVSVLKTLKLI